MGRYRKEISVKRTSVTIDDQLQERINNDRRPGETQAQVIKRWYMGGGMQSYEIERTLTIERDNWEREIQEWKSTYYRDMEMAGNRVKMLEEEVKRLKSQIQFNEEVRQINT